MIDLDNIKKEIANLSIEDKQKLIDGLNDENNLTNMSIDDLLTDGKAKIKKITEKTFHKLGEEVENITSEFVDKIIDKSFSKKSQENIKIDIEFIQKQRQLLPLEAGTISFILTISSQFLTFGAAGVALLFKAISDYKDNIHILQFFIYPILIFYVFISITSITTLIYYLAQSVFRYPFLSFDKIGNAWPYFYYKSINPNTPRIVFQSRKSRKNSLSYYGEDMLQFTANISKSTYLDWLKQELRQYFLLISYQGYAHQFSLKLTHWFLGGIILSCSVLIGLFLGLIL